jgi:putative ABC transport system permease protein
MSLLRSIARGVRALFRKEQVDRELDEELRTYQEMATEEKMRQGLSRKEAARAVRLERGNLEVTKEVVRSAGWESVLETGWQDLRFALRMMRRSPVVTSTAIVTIALAVGANAAIFSADTAVLFRPLPYKHPERLLEIFQSYYLRPGENRMPVSPANYFEWKSQASVFSGVAASRLADFNLSGNSNPERVLAAEVTANLFDVLGVEPLLGRGFRPQDDNAGSDPVTLLSYSLWQRRFAADPGIVGKTIRANGKIYSVVGIMPPKFRFPIGWLRTDVEIWSPLVFQPADRSDRRSTPLDVVARLAPNVSLQQAQSAMDLVSRRLSISYPETNKHWGANVMLLGDRGIMDWRPLLVFMSMAVGLVLLIACANIANLLLARSVTRQRELALRAALGAGRLRLFRQLLTEGIALCICGGALGIVTAYLGIHVISTLAPTLDIPELTNVTIDARVLVFLAAISLAAGALFSLAPAVTYSAASLGVAIQEGARGASSLRQSRLKTTLVIGEIALTLVLLVCAGALVHSLETYMSRDPGFDPNHVLIVRVVLAQEKYKEPAQWTAFYAKLEEEVSSIPGVQAAATGSGAPMEQAGDVFRYEIPGKPSKLVDESPLVEYCRISPSYFRTTGIRLESGRTFSAGDTVIAAPVAIVNQAFAQKEFPNRNAIGQWVLLRGDVNQSVNGDDHPRRLQIIGVAHDEREYTMFHATPSMLYAPIAQDPQPGMAIVVKTNMSESVLMSTVRQRLLKIDPDQAIYNIRPLTEIVREMHSLFRFNTLLLNSFALLATVLSLSGIYGVISYSVAQRFRDFGIRITLGATKARLFGDILRQAAMLGVCGIAIGAVAAVPVRSLLARTIKSSMYIDLVTGGPMLFAAIGLTLLAVSLLASYIPARRASRVDPIMALRCE